MRTDNAKESRFGATADEWISFSRRLPGRLQTVVANPAASISPGSSLRALGKVPSRYNKAREVVGIPDWPRRPLSEKQICSAMHEPDYGICVILGRGLAAFDVDIEDQNLANLFETTACRYGLRRTFVRFRENSARRLIIFRITKDFGKSVLRSDFGSEGCVEILGDGQQFIAAGTHTSGARYQWREIREW